ncbi:MAG TPA: hypothetical protein VM510_15875 [Caulifigura sp.]|jgi:hypothetical protein|nr:hypothetical protein [Caulifigura sp.]
MRRCLILVCAVGLLSGCITATEIENSGLKTTRSYVLFIPVKKSVVQLTPSQVEQESMNGRRPRAGGLSAPATAKVDVAGG